MTQITKALYDVLATTYGLYLKTQNYHWNIVGPEFYSLHILLEKHYEEMADAVDEIAERIRGLGETVDGSFSGFQKRSKVKEGKPSLGWKQMVKDLLQGHEAVIQVGQPWIRKSQDAGDEVTGDLLIRRLSFHEKAAWMLSSQLKS